MTYLKEARDLFDRLILASVDPVPTIEETKLLLAASTALIANRRAALTFSAETPGNATGYLEDQSNRVSSMTRDERRKALGAASEFVRVALISLGEGEETRTAE